MDLISVATMVDFAGVVIGANAGQILSAALIIFAVAILCTTFSL